MSNENETPTNENQTDENTGAGESTETKEDSATAES